MSNRQQARGRRQTLWALFSSAFCLVPDACRVKRGFTLIETLVAVSLLAVAITAPMTLTLKSLSAAYYARDQITAFHLAQEAIESVRHTRDHNILETALGTPTNLLAGIPDTSGGAFTVDTRNDAMVACTDEMYPPDKCPPLSTNGDIYGYPASGETVCPAGASPEVNSCWGKTRFTRVVKAVTVASDSNSIPQEIRISVTVSWRTGSFQTRTVAISENLYRWVEDGSGSN